jgi:hypothetical protein
MTFVLACFQASAAPRLETPDSKEKDALFGLDTIFFLLKSRPTSANLSWSVQQSPIKFFFFRLLLR